MREADEKPENIGPRRKRGISIGVSVGLIVIVILAGILFAVHLQNARGTQTSSSTPNVQITRLALPTGTSADTPAVATAADWTMYHGDNARSGLRANMPDPGSLSTLWKKSLDGAVYAEPLVVNGLVIVASENDSLYAFNATSGQQVWKTSVGSPVSRSDLPCGNVDPLGITGTPVYDPQTGLIFAVAEIEGPAHILVGVDSKTGEVKVRRVVDPPGIEVAAHQQRAALALSGGIVYIAFGGLYGDCDEYHGLVVGAKTDGNGDLLTYQVPTPREGGIWAPGGPSIDGQGNLYVSVGNGEVTQGDWDHTDSVLRLSPDLQLSDGFAPQNWQSDNAADLDLSSMAPVLLPNGLIFIQGKSNQGYLLQADRLGGIGGQIQAISVCRGGAYGGAAINGAVAYIPCTDGVRQIKSGANNSLSLGWQAPDGVAGSPVIGGQTVYSVSPGKGTLYALNAATGAVRTSIEVGTTTRFATPTLYQNTIFIGTQSGIVAVELHGK